MAGIFGWIKELSGRRNQGQVVVVCSLFKIMVYLYQMLFPVAPVSFFRLNVLVEFIIIACLYEFNLGGTICRVQ